MSKKFFLFSIYLMVFMASSLSFAASPVNPEALRIREIKKDALKEAINPEDIQLVVLMPPNVGKKPIGNENIVQSWYSLAFFSALQSEELNKYNPRLVSEKLASSSISKTVQAISETENIKSRYVLLLDWTTSLRPASGTWFYISVVTEDVLYDRQENQAIWQSLRRYERYTQANTENKEIQRDLIRHIERQIIHDIVDRQAQLNPGGKYELKAVDASNMKMKPGPERARLVIFDDYNQGGKSYEYMAANFELLLDSDYSDNKSRYGLPAFPFQLGWKSYIAYDLLPGQYSLFTGVDKREPLNLKPETTTYVRYYRGFLNANKFEEIDEVDATKLFKRSKNSLLTDETEVTKYDSPSRFTLP